MAFRDGHTPSSSYTGQRKARPVDLVAVGAEFEKAYKAVYEACKPVGSIIPAGESDILFTDPMSVAVHNIDHFKKVQADFKQSLEGMVLASAMLKSAGGVIPTRMASDPQNTGLEYLEKALMTSRMQMSNLLGKELRIAPLSPVMQAMLEKIDASISRPAPNKPFS